MLRFSVLLMVLFCLYGCQASKPIHVDIHAASDLNLVSDGDSSPVVVRVYQLNDDHAFIAASFHDLWKDDQYVLGRTQLVRKEKIVKPNSDQKISMSQDEGARYIGILALFRTPDEQSWRAIYPLSPGIPLVPKKIPVHLETNHVSIERIT